VKCRTVGFVGHCLVVLSALCLWCLPVAADDAGGSFEIAVSSFLGERGFDDAVVGAVIQRI